MAAFINDGLTTEAFSGDGFFVELTSFSVAANGGYSGSSGSVNDESSGGANTLGAIWGRWFDGSVTDASGTTTINSQTGSGNQEIGSVDGAVRAQTGSGNIRIERTGGSLHAQTGSGSIQADSVGGEVRAQTGSGRVEVRQIARADVSVQTGSGSVTLNLPSDAAYTLNAHTGSGSISTSQPLTVQGRIGRNKLTGTVRCVGNTITLRTGSGSIDIR